MEYQEVPIAEQQRLLREHVDQCQDRRISLSTAVPKMRILLLSPTGQLGVALANQYPFDIVRPKYYNNMDSNDIRDFLPLDAVIICAARVNVKWCEDHPREAHSCNYRSPKKIIDQAIALNIKICFISSNYVFHTKLFGSYYETDMNRNPMSYYGLLKKYIEDIILSGTGNYLIIRTANIIGCKLPTSGTLYGGLEFMQPTDVSYLAAAVIKLLKYKRTGIYHIAGKPILRQTWFAERVPNISMVPYRPTSEYALRPTRAILNTEKWEQFNATYKI